MSFNTSAGHNQNIFLHADFGFLSVALSEKLNGNHFIFVELFSEQLVSLDKETAFFLVTHTRHMTRVMCASL